MTVRVVRCIIAAALAREPLLKLGLTPAALSPDPFTAFIRSEMERNAKISKALDLKVD